MFFGAGRQHSGGHVAWDGKSLGSGKGQENSQGRTGSSELSRLIKGSTGCEESESWSHTVWDKSLRYCLLAL